MTMQHHENKAQSEFHSARLILASKSPVRAALLRNAGLSIELQAAEIDERAVEEAVGSDMDAEDVALVLAEAKAQAVSEMAEASDAFVIGADQILVCEGVHLHKAVNEDELRRKLLWLSGKTHQLYAAVSVVRNGETLWRYVARADMEMRDLSPEFVGRYMAHGMPDILQSVGGYQLEGAGAQLFRQISGDYFTVLGLPLLPLLSWLRDEDILMR